MSVMFAQLVSMQFQCVRETGEAVISKPLKIENDNPYLQEYMSEIERWNIPATETSSSVTGAADSEALIPLITSQVLLMKLQDLQTISSTTTPPPTQYDAYQQNDEDYTLPAFRRAQPQPNTLTTSISSPNTDSSQSTQGFLGTYESVISKQQQQQYEEPPAIENLFPPLIESVIQYRSAKANSPLQPQNASDEDTSSISVYFPFLVGSAAVIFLVVLALVVVRIRYGRNRRRNKRQQRGIVSPGGMPSTPSSINSLDREAAFLEKPENYGYSSTPPA